MCGLKVGIIYRLLFMIKKNVISNTTVQFQEWHNSKKERKKERDRDRDRDRQTERQTEHG